MHDVPVLQLSAPVHEPAHPIGSRRHEAMVTESPHDVEAI